MRAEPSAEAPSAQAAALALALLIPLVVVLLQDLLWEFIAPFAWLGFLPAVFAVALICGLRGGVLATAVSVAGAEWLLASNQPVDVELPDRQLMVALLFSAMALGLVWLLDRRRRVSRRLHAAVEALRADCRLASPGSGGAGHRPAHRHWLGHAVDDLDAIGLVRHELAVRQAALSSIPLPLAWLAPDGRVLEANPAFLGALGLPGGRFQDFDLRQADALGDAGLARAALAVLEAGGSPGTVHTLHGEHFDLRLEWLALRDCKVLALSLWPGDGTLAQLAAPGTLAAKMTRRRPPALALAAPPTRAMDPARRARQLAGLRCLVVDDHALNRDLLRDILHFDGVEVSTCGSGSEAIQRVREHAAAFDVVLMDLQMPGMDGFAAARALRRLVGAEQLPILAITADGPGIDHERIASAGMQGLLHKPLDVEQLLALLRTDRVTANGPPPRG